MKHLNRMQEIPEGEMETSSDRSRNDRGFTASKPRGRGQAMVELSLVLPFLLMLFCAVVEWGFIFYKSLDMNNAVREAARYAVKDKTTKEKILQKAKDSAMFAIDNLWIVPEYGSPDSPDAIGVTVIGKSRYQAITPLDYFVRLVSKSNPGFVLENIEAQATFVFQERFDPAIFDKWSDYRPGLNEYWRWQGGAAGGEAGPDAGI